MDQLHIMRVLLRDRDKLFAYAWSIVRDTHLAEDVFQEMSLLVIEQRDKIVDEAHLMVCLRQAARLKSLEALRQRNRMPQMLSDETLALLGAHWQRYDAYDSSDMVDALRSCIARLTPYARQIVKLRYVDGLPGQQVAAAVNRKVETVYKSLSRIHRSLRDCIRQQENVTRMSAAPTNGADALFPDTEGVGHA